MLDPQDEHFDQRLARHLVSLYFMTETEAEEEHVVNVLFYFCVEFFSWLIQRESKYTRNEFCMIQKGKIDRKWVKCLD